MNKKEIRVKLEDILFSMISTPSVAISELTGFISKLRKEEK